jgi:hypothetical protein
MAGKQEGEGADQSLMDLAEENSIDYTFDYATGKLVPPPGLKIPKAAVTPVPPPTRGQKFVAKRRR